MPRRDAGALTFWVVRGPSCHSDTGAYPAVALTPPWAPVGALLGGAWRGLLSRIERPTGCYPAGALRGYHGLLPGGDTWVRPRALTRRDPSHAARGGSSALRRRSPWLEPSPAPRLDSTKHGRLPGGPRPSSLTPRRLKRARRPTRRSGKSRRRSLPRSRFAAELLSVPRCDVGRSSK